MNFAFLIHSRNYTDVQRKLKIAKFLPKSWVEFWCLHWPPIIVSKINDFKNSTGWLIGIPLTSEQMLKNRELAQKKIVKAVNKAEKLGAEIVGLGAMTSPVTNGGLSLLGRVNIKITNGNSLTAAISFRDAKNILEKNSDIKKIGIVGATGSIGRATTKLLTKEFPKKAYYLFARNEDRLNKLEQEIISKLGADNINLKGYLNNLQPLKEVDLIVVATSSAEAIIKKEHLKNNAIIYDITQPQNIDKKALKEKPDIKIIDGGLVKIPGLKTRLPFGLPPHTVFACFAETLLLGQKNIRENFSLGKIELEKVKRIMELFKNFKEIK